MSIKKALPVFLLAATLYWFLTSGSQPESPKTGPLEAAEMIEGQVSAPTAEEYEDLQQEHIARLDAQAPFTAEYTYAQSEDLTKEQVAQHEARRVLERRLDEIRSFHGGELPDLTDEDKMMAIELMSQEGLTSVHEDQ